jgi:CheY-like chemotaxis protein
MEGTPHLKVLVVDDSPDYADSTALLMRCYGHEVEVAYSGPDALTKADAFCPDAMLLDIGMPGMSGYAVAQAVRNRPKLHATALIAVTAYSDPAARDRSQAAGFDLHLVKPVDPVVLEQALELVDRTKELFALEERTLGYPNALKHRADLLRDQLRRSRAG